MVLFTNSNLVVIFFTSFLVIFVVSAIAFSEIVEPNHKEAHRGGRSLHKRAAVPSGKVESTPGYKRPANPNATEILTVAKRIISRFNADRIWNCKQKLNKIFGGSTQVITGLRTELDLEICTHACRGRIIHNKDCKKLYSRGLGKKVGKLLSSHYFWM